MFMILGEMEWEAVTEGILTVGFWKGGGGWAAPEAKSAASQAARASTGCEQR